MVDFDGSRSIWLSGPHPDFHSDRVTRKHQYLQQRSAPTQTVTLFKERKKGGFNGNNAGVVVKTGKRHKWGRRDKSGGPMSCTIKRQGWAHVLVKLKRWPTEQRDGRETLCYFQLEDTFLPFWKVLKLWCFRPCQVLAHTLNYIPQWNFNQRERKMVLSKIWTSSCLHIPVFLHAGKLNKQLPFLITIATRGARKQRVRITSSLLLLSMFYSHNSKSFCSLKFPLGTHVYQSWYLRKQRKTWQNE